MNIFYSEYILSKKEKIKYYFLGAIATGIIVMIFFDSLILVMILSPVTTLFFRNKYKIYLLKKRKNIFKTQFIEILQTISSSISTGKQMQEALNDSLNILKESYGKSTPLIIELENILKTIETTGETEEKLLRDLANRLELEDFKNFVEAFSICKETGGDMEKAIKKVTQDILEKLSLEREMKVMNSQKKLESRMISVMPILVIIFLRISSPEYINPLYTTLGGRLVMILSLSGLILAYFLSEKITDIKI